jgi:hypothetical protein
VIQSARADDGADQEASQSRLQYLPSMTGLTAAQERIRFLNDCAFLEAVQG